MKTIYVFDAFSGNAPVHMGNLYVDVFKGGEGYSFEYTEEWLKQNNGNASIDPDLFPFVGRQFPNGNGIFGVFSDASPDRWVNETDNMISVPLAIETAPRFGIDSQKAKEIADGILDTVRSNWETLAAKYGITPADGGKAYERKSNISAGKQDV